VRVPSRCGVCNTTYTLELDASIYKALGEMPGAFDGDGYFKGACEPCSSDVEQERVRAKLWSDFRVKEYYRGREWLQ
jgi:hypothetical protein